MKHTKEPWFLDYDACDEEGFLEKPQYNGTIASRDLYGAVASQVTEANARRIVACVNACDGISTENLEQNKPLIWLARQYNETIKQRDELLTALSAIKGLVCGEALPNWDNTPRTYATRGVIADICDAAIAKVGAGTTATEGHNLKISSGVTKPL